MVKKYILQQIGGNYRTRLLEYLLQLYRDLFPEYSEMSLENKNTDIIFMLLNQLNITNTEIELKNDNLIILRKYNNERELVIACGNSPIIGGGNHMFDYNIHVNIDIDNSMELYKKYHSHNFAYTINIDIFFNPSCICNIIKQKLHFIPDESFTYIYFEGFFPHDLSEADAIHLLSELIRLSNRIYSVVLLGNETLLFGIHENRISSAFPKISKLIKMIYKSFKLEFNSFTYHITSQIKNPRDDNQNNSLLYVPNINI